jgi:thiol-disulfide isomerase/thioredoxin
MSSRTWKVFFAALGLIVWLEFPGAIESSADDPNDDVLGRKIDAIAGTDLNGKPIEIKAGSGDRATVVAFWGTECPLARQYASRLQELHDRFAGDADFICVFSNAQDSPAEIRDYVDQTRMRLTVVPDQDQQIAQLFSARRTPEVYALDEDLVIRYRGRIDDQYGIGYVRPAPTAEYLSRAIEQLLAGENLEIAETEPIGCVIGRVDSSAKDSSITYASDVAEIVQRHCVSCHQPGQIGPMSLTEPTEVAGWGAMIDEVVQQGRMPPWSAAEDIGQFSNERRLTADEKAIIHRWVASGTPIGDTGTIPPFERRPSGWQLMQPPDLVLPVSPEPIDVHETGEMDYLHFRSEYVFPEERWVGAMQILPGNHAVVHHILAFVDSPRGRQVIGELEGIDGYLAGYVPGATVEPYPQGMAKRIPAGSRLIFQVHYTPIGTPEKDQSHIGLYFVDPDSVEREVITTSAIRRRLEIPPGVAAHPVRSYSHRSLDGAWLLGMMPHMHLRGSAFAYELQTADGGVRSLLEVPRYDFHWQTSYQLAEPIELRAGDRIACRAQYDNSAGNPNNPDPTQTVRWGDQTREEMMIGYFDIAVRRDDFSDDPVDLKRHIALVKVMDRYDQDTSGAIEAGEVPRVLSERFESLDQNSDHTVTFAELAIGWRD